jgi:hypothetical protein
VIRVVVEKNTNKGGKIMAVITKPATRRERASLSFLGVPAEEKNKNRKSQILFDVVQKSSTPKCRPL